MKEWTTENIRIIKIATKNKLDPQNTHKKKYWTQEISTRKDFGPTKYPQGNYSVPGRHNDMMACDQRNLVHSAYLILYAVLKENGKSNKPSSRLWIIIDHLFM